MKLALLALLLCACAYRIKPADLGDISGATWCLKPALAISVMNLEVWGTADMLTTPAHEAKHREQFRRYPSCHAVQQAYRTSEGRLAIEAEAYAAGYCAGVKAGLDSTDTYNDMRSRLAGALQGIVARTRTDSAFARFAVCS